MFWHYLDMKILLLSPFFFPEQISTGKYNTHLAEALVLAGHDVTVVASHPIYPNWRAKIATATLPGIEIKRGGAWFAYPRSTMLRRVILELWYAWYAFANFLGLRSSPDVVIAIFPPSLFFMLLNSLMPRAVCRVGIVHDLQGVYATRCRGCLSRVLNFAIHFVEQRCFRACDHLIFLSAAMEGRATSEYQLDKERCSVCYPFVAIENVVSCGDSLVDVLLPSTFNVIYSGALGDKQNPNGLVAFMNKIACEQENVACHIFSAGPIFDELRMNNDAENCQVRFHELVPGEQLAELYSRSDLQIIPQAPNTSEGSLPSKLPNLLASGVPVFVICDSGSELGSLVNEAKAGVVANTWDVGELVSKFNSYRNSLVRESRNDHRLRLREFVKSKFSIDSVLEKVLTAARKKQGLVF